MAQVNVRFRRNPASYSAIIESPTGRVGRLVTERAENARRIAEGSAPRRSGHLAGSHFSTSARKVSRGFNATFGNTAEYAAAVHNGTQSPIVPTRGKFLAFNSRGRDWLAYYVNGQAAQPWLLEAFIDAAGSDIYTDVLRRASAAYFVPQRLPSAAFPASTFSTRSGGR